MRAYLTDLHVHTVLSPCAAVEMTPRLVVSTAVEVGLDILAVTDHNAGDNAWAVREAARGLPLTVWPGMEVESSEEAHVVVLFDDWDAFGRWCRQVENWRNGRRNEAALFGPQWVLDADDVFQREREEMLLSALTADARTLCTAAEAHGGLAIASHVDRPAYSLLGQLGLWPAQVPLAAAEISARIASAEEARGRYPLLPEGLPLVTSSDAHDLETLRRGSKMIFGLQRPVLAELRLALAGREGRWMRWHRPCNCMR